MIWGHTARAVEPFMKQPSGARKPNIWGKIAAIGVLLVVAFTVVTQRRSLMSFARNWEDFSDGSVEAKQLRHLPDLLSYIQAHRRDVSLVVYDVGDEENGIYLHADEPHPWASVIKVQLLLGYSALVAQGELQPDMRIPIETWERYWLPRTDAGAHEQAMRVLRAKGAVQAGGVRLQDLVMSMLRFSDNAAADVLMAQLGRERVAALPAQLDMPDAEPAWPLSGQLLSWQNTQLDEPGAALAQRYADMPRQRYADQAWQLFSALQDPARSAAERARLQDEGLTLRLRDQAALTAATSPRASARAYAQLMAHVAGGQLPGAREAQAALSWMLKNPELSPQFERLGAKSGSLPGLLSEVYYARAKGHDKVRVLAMALDRLPLAVWLQLMQKYVHQQLALKLLQDDTFFEHLKQQLSQP